MGSHAFPCCTGAPSGLACGLQHQAHGPALLQEETTLRSSWLVGEADMLPAQSSLAGPGFVLQLQPVLPSVLLPILSELRLKSGTKETWVASGTREKHHCASDSHQVR